MNISENIKRIRIDKKLSRRELAELTGVSQVYLTSIEFNKRNPTLETLNKLAKGLNVNLEDLFYNPNEVNNQDNNITIGKMLDLYLIQDGINQENLDKEKIKEIAKYFSKLFITLSDRRI
ncbi:helix-turn-helix transcriptional regulator [Clostridium perfringens]|nr:helix-turn-helix transcriptional regulator [Clostridium perfringens]EJT6161735.1 helix-turn-helix transcriptional regulator [Clostridium perfringens]EJT6504216.1 helix-turn-helix transcriptional regulator [Clostridium perfringens]ELC8346216.1 helix-turn-helix transcriptional regulator [Clostridium perfringens]MDK0593332.1 helix-turn-helix transcriptional regulator [Clostridium perfringens]